MNTLNEAKQPPPFAKRTCTGAFSDFRHLRPQARVEANAIEQKLTATSWLLVGKFQENPTKCINISRCDPERMNCTTLHRCAVAVLCRNVRKCIPGVGVWWEFCWIMHRAGKVEKSFWRFDIRCATVDERCGFMLAVASSGGSARFYAYIGRPAVMGLFLLHFVHWCTVHWEMVYVSASSAGCCGGMIKFWQM